MNWPWKSKIKPLPAPPALVPALSSSLRRAVARAGEEKPQAIRWPIKPPELFPGVVPKGEKAQVAMDAGAYEYASSYNAALMSGSMYAYGDIGGFPGYPYLMMLALRVEYRNIASALATEITRKWIKFNSSETAGESTKKKVTEITQEFKRLGIQQIFRLAAEQDALYGSGQILIDIRGAKLAEPLILDKRTVAKGSLLGFKVCEPIWTTPLMYNALDPSQDDFYRPSSWWVMGQHWHASRMLIIVTRWVPDMLKPAFNFSGISLSQLVEPYVNNWLRTRQSVSDLINNFSIIVLKTSMDQVLAGSDDGSGLFDRIRLFTATRSNKGVMALDKEREELEQISVPISGLSELQAQNQEQMFSAAREPVVMATGIAPAGLNTSSEGEIRLWYDWIAAQQEAHYRDKIEVVSKLVQLHLYGEIDPDITFEFNPLYQLSEEQMSTIRVNDSIRAGNYIDRGVLDAQEERERLARDPDSGYDGIDVTKEIEPPAEAELEASLSRGNA